MSTASKVAERKKQYPEKYCPQPDCLWRTPNGQHCPRHKKQKDAEEQQKDSEAAEMAREAIDAAAQNMQQHLGITLRQAREYLREAL